MPIATRLVLACGLCCGAAVCAAQTYTPPPPPLTTLPPCPADKDAKKRAKRKDCDPTVYPSEKLETKGKKGGDTAPAVAPPPGGAAADKFPFPGEQPAASDSAAKKFPYPGDSGGSAGGSVHGDGSPAAPPDPTAEKRAEETSAGKRFPFPGEAPQPADGAVPATAPKPDDPASSASSSTSSSSSSESSSSSDDTAAGDTGKRAHAKNPDDDDDDDPPKLKDKGSSGRRTLKVVKPQSDDDRVDEDLSIAKFYGQSGNYMGAYLRAKDAVKIEPEYPEGHFALGEAAKRLQKKDEAAAEFQAYLKLAPDGEKAKAAEKALEELK